MVRLVVLFIAIICFIIIFFILLLFVFYCPKSVIFASTNNYRNENVFYRTHPFVRDYITMGYPYRISHDRHLLLVYKG